jgi:3-oxoadipate enol-lactonase
MSTARLHFVQQGQGPTVVLSHALGCDITMWDEVAELLSAHYSVLRYDHRGHGRSEAPVPPYSMQMLADDAAALIAEQCQDPVHFVGLSMGGMTAQALAARHPHLVRSIVVANSAQHFDEAAKAMWDTRIHTVLQSGVAAIADGAMQRWFSAKFRAANPARVNALRARLERCDAKSYAASCEAVRSIDFRNSNAALRCPALVIAGALDEATPLAMSEAMAAAIPGAQLKTLQAAHISAVEQPAAFAQLVHQFLGVLS